MTKAPGITMLHSKIRRHMNELVDMGHRQSMDQQKTVQSQVTAWLESMSWRKITDPFQPDDAVRVMNAVSARIKGVRDEK